MCEEYKKKPGTTYKTLLDKLFDTNNANRAVDDLTNLNDSWKGVLESIIDQRNIKPTITFDECIDNYADSVSKKVAIRTITQHDVIYTDTDERYGVCTGCNHRRRY